MSEAATPQEDLGDEAEHRSGPDIGRSSAVSYTHLTLPTNREV